MSHSVSVNLHNLWNQLLGTWLYSARFTRGLFVSCWRRRLQPCWTPLGGGHPWLGRVLGVTVSVAARDSHGWGRTTTQLQLDPRLMISVIP